MIPARVSLITLGARDFDLLRSFYGRLGWPEGMSAPGFVAYRTGGAILALFPVEDLAADSNSEGATTPPSFRGVACAINVQSAQIVDEAIAAAGAAGAQIVKPPVDADWGGRSGYFADPEGNLWEVAWLPGSSFDEGGSLILPPDE